MGENNRHSENALAELRWIERLVEHPSPQGGVWYREIRRTLQQRWCVKTYLGKAKGAEVIDIPQQIAIDYEWREVPTVIATVDQGETR